MTCRIITTDKDTSGLGRWNHVTIAGKDQKQVTIMTAYRPCKQSTPGDSTVNAQQHHILQNQGEKQLQPRTLWIKDVMLMIKKWMTEGEVMLLVDANSGLGDKGFAPFIAEVGLCNVIRRRHGIDSPNTHADGSKTIDFIFCSPGMIETVKRSGMLCFYDGIHSDHQGLYCDVNTLHLLRGKIHNIPSKPTWRYHTKYKKRGRQYRADVSNIIQQKNLCQQAKKLA
eukprot:9520858-Ditylum_brightwellii.AAC.1